MKAVLGQAVAERPQERANGLVRGPSRSGRAGLHRVPFIRRPLRLRVVRVVAVGPRFGAKRIPACGHDLHPAQSQTTPTQTLSAIPPPQRGQRLLAGGTFAIRRGEGIGDRRDRDLDSGLGSMSRINFLDSTEKSWIGRTWESRRVAEDVSDGRSVMYLLCTSPGELWRATCCLASGRRKGWLRWWWSRTGLEIGWYALWRWSCTSADPPSCSFHAPLDMHLGSLRGIQYNLGS